MVGGDRTSSLSFEMCTRPAVSARLSVRRVPRRHHHRIGCSGPRSGGVRRVPGLDSHLALRLRHHLAAFGAVADVSVDPARSPRSSTASTSIGKERRTLAGLILSHKTLEDRHGQHAWHHVRRRHESAVRRLSSARSWAGLLAMTALSCAPGTCSAVLGQGTHETGSCSAAGWENPAGGRCEVQGNGVRLGEKLVPCEPLSAAGVLRRAGARPGNLVYAESGGRPSMQVTKGVPRTLRTQEVSLRGTPEEILERAERVALLLVEEAKAREKVLSGAST